MPSELLGGDSFSDGQTVNAARLNNLVNLGTVLSGLISDKTGGPPNPLPTDYVLFLRTADGTLQKALFSNLPSAVTSVGVTLPSTEFTVTGSPVTSAGTIAATWKNQPGNKFFAGNGTGGGTTPSFRLITADDLSIASVTVAAQNIDWSLGNVFFKQLTTGTTLGMSFTNVQDGQTIRVLISHGVANSSASFPLHIWWKGAAYPVQTALSGPIDLYTFTAYGAGVLGKGDMNYQIID
jgi:hypothetical protein